MTVDAWQGLSSSDFLAVLVSWVDDAWERHEHVLAARPLGESKGFQELGQKLITTFRDCLGVSYDVAQRTFLLTLDNEAAGLKAARALGIQAVCCSAHCAQICVKCALFYETQRHQGFHALIEGVR